jgi:dihydroorotase
LAGQGQPLRAGAPAELTLYDPAASRIFGTGDLAGQGLNSPYLAMTLPGRVQATFHRGRPTVLDGMLREPGEVDTVELGTGSTSTAKESSRG